MRFDNSELHKKQNGIVAFQNINYVSTKNFCSPKRGVFLSPNDSKFHFLPVRLFYFCVHLVRKAEKQSLNQAQLGVFPTA